MPTANNAVLYKKLAVPENVIVIPPESHVKYRKLRKLRSFFISPFHLFRIIGIFFMELWILRSSKKICIETIKTAHKFLLAANLLAFYLNKYLYRNLKINIIYTYWFKKPTMAALLCKKYLNMNIKCITRTHGADLYEFVQVNNYQPYKIWMDKYIDRVFFISKAGFDYYLRLFARSLGNKYVLARLGIENTYTLQNTASHKYENNCLDIISCSNMIPLKRIQLIILALSGITDISIKWVHIGDGSERNKLEIMAKNLLENKKNIIYSFLGHFDNDYIKKYYYENYFDCFVSTTESEGLPVSMMEAISFGIPIISSNVGGVSEIVNNETGILLDPDNCVDELMDALHKFASMPVPEKEALRKSCRKYWENNFKAETQYTQFVKHIMELLI